MNYLNRVLVVGIFMAIIGLILQDGIAIASAIIILFITGIEEIHNA